MSEKVDYDVLISGGGPAGISTWLHLNKHASDIASRTIVLEKEAYPRDKLCGGAISSWGQDILKKFHIHINAPCIEIANTQYQFEEECYFKKEPGFLKIFRRIELDHELVKAAINKGLNIHQQETIQEISNKNNFLIVKTTKQTYRTKVLVGADGAFSTVRNHMKLKNKPCFATGIELYAPVNPTVDTEYQEKTAVLDFTPINQGLQGYFWHFPCINEDQPFMNHGIYNSRLKRNIPKVNINEMLNQQIQSRNITKQYTSWSGHPIPLLDINSTLSQPHIILAGDAAGIEPLLGGGIHLALSYGDVAVSTILNAFDHQDFSFQTYQERLRNHLVGKYIKKLTYLAHEVYSKNMNVLDAVRNIFSA